MKEHEEAATSQAQQQERVLLHKVLPEPINKLREVLDLIEENDPDVKRSSTVSHRVLANFGCYEELLREKQQKTVLMPITSFFQKREKEKEQEPQEEG